MQKATLYLHEIRLNSSQTHKLRGYIGNVFSKYDLIHNHDILTGKNIYRYPRIQFKIIDKTPCIIALTEKAVQIFSEIFMSLDEIVIEGRTIPIFEKDLKIENDKFGFSKETYMYEFIIPWIGLNQKNFKIFANLSSEEDQRVLLKKILTGNILSMSKSLDLYLKPDQRIDVDLKLEQTKVTLKGKQMTGFKGMFKANFLIPDYLGIGKSVSRGFGSIRKLI